MSQIKDSARSEAESRTEERILGQEFVSTAAAIQAIKQQRQAGVFDSQTHVNTRKNRAITYERCHILRVSRCVSDCQDPDGALEFVRDFFDPYDDVPFWLVPNLKDNPGRSPVSSLSSCDSSLSSKGLKHVSISL
ncbi:hypothetical protein FVE85_4509 [Porphyridium purpureum]|uniref:Uncharacterized protein n=1 Tax=Porphyridium purpureum TaxID=35688 RepID=A0A5J4YJ61_PORPP|nr:hypothetical protein FVE85_4509 [Porphyridium purpureum]|eukprot:POR3087..scf297_16